MQIRCKVCGEEPPHTYRPTRFVDYCPNCDKEHIMSFAPDNPKNKVYAVDVYATVARCFAIEASSEDEARGKAEELFNERMHGLGAMQALNELRDMGFEDTGDNEFTVSGECDSDGEIEYY